ncbi:ferritin-like domain-containing protein [Actinomadura sp. HBU206391]|uniref:ferritin-like domain-containing protein n=1 Tax=Actinomadura sp. HBU206391 TaxID=2731692 RepID=UPI0016506646|nr:ferritin-like domain-containing protein [Actinomadura sp. HBU206391]MBC6462602.1 ferritin-like domain-containing protein [Actinomadura sp. HBU206391]
MTAVVDLGGLGFESGAHLLLRRALGPLSPGALLAVYGRDPALRVHLPAWCRGQGHRVEMPSRPGGPVAVVVRGSAVSDRWSGAVRSGSPHPGAVVERPPASWGLAARGALVEPGGPEPLFAFEERDHVWADIAPRLYAQAAARQWDPATAIPWDAECDLPAEVESAVVQVMTYLVENEQVALLVPARFIGGIHPHFREVVQLLAVQVADEARHMEVFTRRALLKSPQLGTSSAGGRESLFTLVKESDFSLASFLLSVLGEGSFVDLLAFLERHAPDPVTRSAARLALQDERRHVVFGVAHLARQAEADPGLHGRLRTAIERRHDVLADTAGLNEDVFDALVVLAAGAWTPEAVATGFARVRELQQAMDDGRRRRLERLGFPADEAAELSRLHTRNFM